MKEFNEWYLFVTFTYKYISFSFFFHIFIYIIKKLKFNLKLLCKIINSKNKKESHQ